MNRLIQGDVGSGKTILAFLALLLCVDNGYQGALMAPTEILATQHFEQICAMTKEYELPFKPVLLTGSMTAKRSYSGSWRLSLRMNSIVSVCVSENASGKRAAVPMCLL